MSEKWYKIDNAGKIFPTIWNKNESSSFRISAVLKNEIDESLLMPALKSAMGRFPTFCVKLKEDYFGIILKKIMRCP